MHSCISTAEVKGVCNCTSSAEVKDGFLLLTFSMCVLQVLPGSCRHNRRMNGCPRHRAFFCKFLNSIGVGVPIYVLHCLYKSFFFF